MTLSPFTTLKQDESRYFGKSSARRVAVCGDSSLGFVSDAIKNDRAEGLALASVFRCCRKQ